MRTQPICLALVIVLTSPFASAQWVQTNGPYGGGDVTCVAVSGSNLFAAVRGYSGAIEVSDIFLSTNNGTSWTASSDRLMNTWVNALVVSGANLFAGTSTGVYLSTSNGITWTAVDSGLTDHYVMALAVFGTSLFAGTASGVFLSTNNGASWAATGPLNHNVHALAMSDTKLIASTEMGVYCSTNSGTNWTPSGLTNTAVSPLKVSGTNLLAGTYENGVFLSTNNGADWTEVNNGFPKNPYDTTHYIPVMAFEVIGTNIVAGTQDGVYRSTNDGASWSAADSALTRTNVMSLAVSGTNLFAGTLGAGVLFSSDTGSSWTPVNYGLVRTDVKSLAVSGSNLFWGSSDGVFLSPDNGTSWTAAGLTDTRVSALAGSGKNLFAGTEGGDVFRSTDNGASWSEVNNGLETGYGPAHAFAFSSNGAGGTNLFVATSRGVFLSTNNGTNWTKRNSGLENVVSHMAVSGTTVYAVTAGSRGAYLTTDNGTNWRQIAPSDLMDANSVVIIGQMLFVGSYLNGVNLSTDNGTTWTKVNNGLWTTNVLSLAAVGPNLFAGVGGYIFLSTNRGTTWTVVNGGFPTGYYGVPGVSAFAVSDSILYAICQSDVWKRPLIEMVMVPPHPFISSIADVAGDEGGKVSMSWSASELDTYSAAITYYSIWRSVSQTINPVALAQPVASITPQVKGLEDRTTMFNGKEYSWKWMANVPACQSTTYSYTAPTVSDSMSTTNGINYFFVLAHTNDPSVFYSSNIDSGYSVDNLAPLAPQNLDYNLYADAVFLRWNPNTESDLNRYAIYRSAHPIANPSLLQPYAYSRDWVFVDSTALQRGYYRIRAQDIHENYSLPSNQVRVIGAGPHQPQWMETSLDSVGARCFAQNGTILFAGTGRGVFRSTDGDTNWTAVNAGLTDTGVNGLTISGTNLFAVTNSGVFVCNNNGGSWTQAGLTGSGVTSIAARGMDLYAGSSVGVVRSTDGGTSWIQVDSGLTCKVVNSLAVSPDGSGGTNLLAGTGTCYWKFGCQGGLFLLSDNATIWTSLGLSGKAVMSLAVVPQGTGGTYFLAGLLTGGVLRCAGNDTIWIPADSGLGDLRVSCFAVTNRNIFAGTDQGVFLSTNNGTAWVQVSTGLTDTSITAISVSGSNLFAGTYAGVWRRPLSELVAAVPTASHEMPHSFGLDQNYPNPFNPTTKIQFTIVNRQSTIVKVYDLLGREVTTLVNEVKSPGTYTVKFDGSNLASGVYLYRIQAGGFVQTRKLLLMK